MTPASPLAQPWSVIGGNLVSAAIGVACARAVADPTLAAALAICLAIAAMFTLRCVHPPSGAIALTAVLGGAEVHAAGRGHHRLAVADGAGARAEGVNIVPTRGESLARLGLGSVDL